MAEPKVKEQNPILWVVLAALLVATNTLGHGFILDDISKIVQNPDLRSYSGLLAKLFRPYTESFQILERNDPSRPLVFFIYTVLYHLADGARPFLFHLVNVLTHVGASVLVYRLARRWWKAESSWLPLGVALAFAVLPLQMGVVAYAYALSDLLASLLLLGTLDLFLTAHDREDRTARRWSWICLVGALACKQSAVVLPVLTCLVLAYEGAPWKKALRATRSLWAVVVAYVALRGLLLGGIGDLEGRGNTWPWMEYITTQPYILLRYVQLALWPQGLAVDHFLIPAHVTHAQRALGILCWSAMVGVVFWCWRHRARSAAVAALGLGLAWYLVCLAPTSSLVPTVDLLVERRTYLANFGLLFALGALLSLLARRGGVPPRMGLALVGVVLVGYAGYSVKRAADNSTADAIWREVLSIYPDSPRALNNYSAWLIDHERFDEARALLEGGLSRAHDDAFLWANLGSLFQNERYANYNLEVAAQYFRKAIALRPILPDSYYNLGRILQIQGQRAEAEQSYRESLRQRPNFAPALNNLGLLYLNDNDKTQARTFIEQALQADPAYAPALKNLDIANGRVAESSVANDAAVPREAKQIPAEQIPTELILKTYRDHLRKHPKDKLAHKKMLEFCAQRKVKCD
ncbi:MAG: tetratricopeptide repeat protein [Bdellovibrionales bacterium]|nr:tetratricopeptide repeat protein [Bdellovibrionales bacterium]